MKVLLISNMYPSAEKPYAGVFVKNQYEELLASVNESESIEIYYMLRTFTSPLGSLWKYFKAFAGFIPKLFKHYDVIHLHYFYPLIMLAWGYKLLRPKTQIICTFHGSDIHKQVNGGFNQRLFYYFSRCIDLGIPVGLKLQEAVIEKLAPMPLTVLCAGVNHHVFYPPESPQPKVYDFTWVGTFEHRKGLDLYLQAISNLNLKHLKFCFIGSGPMEPLLLEAQKEFDITIKHDLSQDQIREDFFQSKFQILCSRSEPFGLVVSEAMFCGVPACVTDSGGMAEQVEHGVNGFIAPEVSVKGIETLIQDALNLEEGSYKEFSQIATQNKLKFSLEHVVQQHLYFYRSLAAGQSAQSLIGS